jgi:hypothetical protein
VETVRATRRHFREGSTGGEFISALLKVVLSVTGHANASSSIFTVLSSVPGGTWMLLSVGAAHLVAWTQPDRNLTARAVRKACSCVGLAVWISLAYDLMERGATATIILISPMLVLMAYAIGRRRYEFA